MGVECVEEEIVLGWYVGAAHFQLGDGQGLDEPGHLVQALAEGLCGGGAVVKHEAMRGVRRIGIGRGVEALRFQRRQCACQAVAALRRQLVARRALADDARERVEVELLAVRAAQRRAQALRRPPALGVAVRRAQDVGQLLHQTRQVDPEALGLGLLRHFPGLRDQACGHGGIAAEHFAIGTQRAAGLREPLLQRVAFAQSQARGSSLPQLGQAALRTGIDGAADFGLQLQAMAAHALALDAARRHVAQHRVNQLGQGLHELAAALRHQHQGEVVAQRRQLAVGRQQRRPQALAVDGAQSLAAAPAAEVEDDLVLVPGLHVHRVSLRFQAARRAGSSPGSASGQKVNLSNSRSKPARMAAGLRSWPAWRRSS